MNPELQAKVALWRQMALQGTLTPEVQVEAIAAIRAGRKGAAIASETSRGKKAAAAKPTPSGDDLLSEMMG